MATEEIVHPGKLGLNAEMQVLTLSGQETVDLIAALVAQLNGSRKVSSSIGLLPLNPEVTVIDRGVTVRRVLFQVERDL